MKERIKELADEAQQYAEYVTPQGAECFDNFKQKFTELIIQECSKVILEWKKEPFPFDEDLAVQLIHEHFELEVPPKTIRVIKI